MAVLDSVLHKCANFPSHHFSRENKILGAGQLRWASSLSLKKGSYHNTKYLTAGIKCLKGETKPHTPLIDTREDVRVPLAPANESHDITRADFPHDFRFGASTSALQTEGAGNEGGRGKSTWDFMIEAQKGRKAVDSYNRYKDDVKLLKDMGMDSYRFSIAWPRILPKGTRKDGINQEGIDFYNNFIDELLKNGITPFVTLFHFDLPVPLQEAYGGFLDKRIVNDFKEYAELCFEKFGDRVKHWATINEPFVYGSYGYKMGLPEDKKNNPLNPYISTHHIILAHAATTKAYRDNFKAKQGGEIGISLVCKWFEPHTTEPMDHDAAKKAADFVIGWYMDPLCNGDYPASLKEWVHGLPKFTDEERKLVKGAYDFIGVNYYTSRYAKPVKQSTIDLEKGHVKLEYIEEKVDRNGKHIGDLAEGSDKIYIYPQGLRDLLVYLKTQYKDPKIYITENGVPSKPTVSISVKEAEATGRREEIDKILNDDYRIEHVRGHIHAVHEAMKKGANVKGYFVWTLMDNMEVGEGYEVRFGLNYVDYLDNHERYPKKSAKWFHDFLKPLSNESTKNQILSKTC